MRIKIKTYLRPLRIKMASAMGLNLLIKYSIAALVATLCILIASRVSIIPNYLTYCLYTVLGALGIWVGHVAFKLPTTLDAMKFADQQFFDERLVTAFEFADEHNDIVNQQRQDTKLRMQQVKSSELFTMRIERKAVLTVVILIGFIMGVYVVNTASSIEGVRLKHLRHESAEVFDKLDDSLVKSLLNTPMDQQKIEKIKTLLEQKLNNIESEEDALKALSAAKNELQALANSIDTETFTESQQQALESALTEINQAAKSFDNAAMSDFAFENAIDNALNTSTLAEMDGYKSQLNDQTNSGMKADNQSGAGGAKQDEGNSATQGENSNQKENQQAGQGATNSVKSDNASNGSGQGSTNEKSAARNEGAKSSGDSATEHKKDIYEALYPPELLGGASTPTYVDTESSNEGKVSYKQKQTLPADAGELVDYQSVLAITGDRAAQVIDTLDVPNAMREDVKAYFSELSR